MPLFGSSKDDVAVQREAYYAKLKTDLVRLTDEANGLVKFVQDAQPERLADFNKEWETNKAFWSFRAERWGDFLALYIASRTRQWDEIGNCYHDVAQKAQMSVRLDPEIVIRMVEGHPPDREGRQGFSWMQGDDGERILRFDGVFLPTKKTGSYSWSGGVDYTVPVTVSGIVRPEEPDKIIFGAGGVSQWGDMQRQRSEFTYTDSQKTEWDRLRSGATVSVPATLGQQVYRQVLKASRGAAP